MCTRRNALAAQRLVTVFCIFGALQPPHAAAVPQNPFEVVALGALSLASSAAEMLQNGARAEHAGGFQTPFFGVRSHTEVGMGQVMRRRTDDSSEEDSDEDRRRKRAVVALAQHPAKEALQQVQPAPHSHLHRSKRTPCHIMRPSTSGDGGDAEGVEDVRRRSARMQARKRSAYGKKTKARNAKTNATKSGRRRRRQTEVDDLEGDVQNVSKQFSDHLGQFSEKVCGIFESIFNAMNEVMQRVKQKLSGGAGAGQGMPDDAENI